MNQYNLSGLRIDPAVFQHPADKAITEKIRKSDAFKKVLSFISEHGLEHMLYSLYLSSYAHMTPKNAPELTRMCEEAGEMFGLERTPELFLTRDYNMYGKLQCINKPVILLSTEMVNNLSERGTWAAIASCACGARSGYSEIDMISWTVNTVGALLPPGVVSAVNELVRQWKKTVQLTFDRAALLATGDLNTAMQMILGGEIPSQALSSIDFRDPSCGYMQQCREFAANQGMVMNALRAMEAIGGDGALLATRYIELFNFYQNEFEDLMEEYAG
ncbi:MAG: hypothetical protein IJ313_05195 [Clostridia bacterium]|nr:hypothetical protein [Clostridia bacterium]